MPEGLSPVDAGEALQEHRGLAEEQEREKRLDRTISIFEATLLALVAVFAAWSGYSAAKWSTDSSLHLSKASADRALANAASLSALDSLNFDITSFDAWFTAYVAGNPSAQVLAENRFTPNFRTAFEAWLDTDPAKNPDSPPGPTDMPQYRQPLQAQASRLNAAGEAEYTAGETAGANSDDYVFTTIYLATVLFLAGIAGHFRYRAVRYGLAGVGTAILLVALIRLATAAKPAGRANSGGQNDRKERVFSG